MPRPLIFLPIAERELRVAARKRSTFWVRVFAVLTAFVIGGVFLILAAASPSGFAGPSLGRPLFTSLTWLGLVTALSAGVFFTSDCLSAEKREGTMGFLFLTSLRGHDVVLGKLLATSLQAASALIGIFPVLAITLLMGGVMGIEFWHTCLAIALALFSSLTAGLLVSAVSRDSQKAMTATLALLIALAMGGPMIDSFLSGLGSSQSKPLLSLSSPVHLFMAATNWTTTSSFWPAVAANGIVSCAMLALASVILPRAWQSKSHTQWSPRRTSRSKTSLRTPTRRETRRRILLAANPALWLASRAHWQGTSVWVFAIVLLISFVAVFSSSTLPIAWFIWNSVAGLFTILLYLAVASQASRFLVEARRSRLLDLLLTTPLTSKMIVHGQWRALTRVLTLPLAICLLTQFTGSFMVQQITWNQIANTAPAPPPTAAPTPTNAPTNAPSSSTFVLTSTAQNTTNTTAVTPTFQTTNFVSPGYGLALAINAIAILAVGANLVALMWFGMWMGVTSKSANVATLKTILFVQVIPWFAITFAAGLTLPLILMPMMMKQPSTAPASMGLWFPLLSGGVGAALALAKDVTFISWSRRKLYLQLRERVVNDGARERQSLPPLLPTSIVRSRPQRS